MQKILLSRGLSLLVPMPPKKSKFNWKDTEKANEIFITTRNAKCRSKEEESVYKFARSSIVADKDLKKGSIISEFDIWSRRPGNGEIPAHKFDEILGKKLNKFIKKNTQLKWSDFE